MENHEILAPALQKFYSALKSLDEFGRYGNFFDDVSNLDKFFSEFRNITFVIQKNLKTEENKKTYEELRDSLLSGDTLKWFINTRNKTTKERPFELKKELAIDLYLPHGLYTLKDSRLVVDVDASFNDALDYIRSVCFENLGLVEVFFTSRITFREANDTLDLYPKIRDGIAQMNQFLEEIGKHFPCDCEICQALKCKIETLFRNIQFKELNFISDYTLELGKEAVEGEKAAMYFSMGDAKFFQPSELRATLDNPIFKDSKGCLRELFLRFSSMHTVIFQMQEHDIMPVFMLVYDDQTYRMIPFVATTKATFYRRVLEIISMPDFNEVSAVFYCGEYYLYDVEQLQEINERPYSERIHNAQKEILSFVMIAKGGGEMSIVLDESRIEDIQYISEQFRQSKWCKPDDAVSFDWLNPIRLKLNS